MTTSAQLADIRDYLASSRPKPAGLSGPRVFVDAQAWQQALADAGVRVIATDFAEYRPWCAFVCAGVSVRVFVGDDRTEVQLDQVGGFIPTNLAYTWIDVREPTEVIAQAAELIDQTWLLRRVGP